MLPMYFGTLIVGNVLYFQDTDLENCTQIEIEKEAYLRLQGFIFLVLMIGFLQTLVWICTACLEFTTKIEQKIPETNG